MERWARSHETKVALENAINLWQLVETRFSEKRTDDCQVCLSASRMKLLCAISVRIEPYRYR